MDDDFGQEVSEQPVLDILYRLFAISSAVFLAPYLFTAFIGLSLWRHVYLRLLRSRQPHLEVLDRHTVRSVADTRRNQGLLTALVGLRAPLQLEDLRARIQEQLVERRDGRGRLSFPRLRCALTSRWGRYAWCEERAFHVSSHVLQLGSAAPADPDGPWAQQVASEACSKFLPAELSPWQVAVLPAANLVLIRMHHLIQEEGPSLLELVCAVCPLPEDDENPPPACPPPPAPPPLLHALPQLYAHLMRSVAATWSPLAGKGVLTTLARLWWWSAVELPLSVGVCAWQLLVGRGSLLRLAPAAASELWWLAAQVAAAPAAVFGGAADTGTMRAGPLTGRKVVAWSERVELPRGGDDAAVAVAAAALSLRAYFSSPDRVPQRVLCVASLEPGLGCVTLALPTAPACDFAAPGPHPRAAAALRLVQRALRDAAEQQVLLRRLLRNDCPLVRLLPSPLMRLLLNVLSRRYPVCLSLVPNADAIVPAAYNLLVWQPPQANVCLSLNLLLEHGGRICRLAVMADSLVAPHHMALAEAFPASVRELAEVLSNQRHRTPPTPPPSPLPD